jgi:hypothetical protein
MLRCTPLKTGIIIPLYGLLQVFRWTKMSNAESKIELKKEMRRSA